MRWLIRKLFLRLEIKKKTGELHFQRFILMPTPWFNLYFHRIYRSDEDKHFHDHPWDFVSLLVRGAYKELSSYWPDYKAVRERVVAAGELIMHEHSDAHHIELLTPEVWSIVLVSAKTHAWGYQTEHGWMQHEKYRAWKHAGFPNPPQF